jgi:hypothetical protein
MSNFKHIVVCDFEYEIADGNLPDVLCTVAQVLDENFQLLRTIKLWRGEFGAEPPFDIGPDALFVAYSAWAEMTCFKVLGWKFPEHIFDQHTAYLASTNILQPYSPGEVRQKPRKRLPDACRAYDIAGWENIDKEDIAQSIGNGTWRGRYSPEDVITYCAEDVRLSTLLLRAQLLGHGRQLPPVDVAHVLHWSNYSAKCIALIQARGMPIDMHLWNLVQENKAAVISELLRRHDPSHGDVETIYDADGRWSYARFERWLLRAGIGTWPRLASGKLDLDGDAFELMYHVPGIDGLHALRKSINVIVKAELPIGRDGRNRPKLFPFGTATGRNAHAKSLYNAHAGMRSFMVFPENSTGAYLDWRTQEVGIAAALSGDQALIADYSAGDIYHALALLCGLTREPDAAKWKRENPEQRERMKRLQLGINYGMGVRSLARGLDRHPIIASNLIERHRRRYPPFWRWRDDTVNAATIDRKMTSIFGWPLHISTSPNERTLYNFPMQSGGAEMLRLAVVRLCDAGIVPCMLIHDGILFEETEPEKIDQAREIMVQAGRDCCDGLQIGASTDQLLRNGARYRDKRPMAVKMWATIMDVLRSIGVPVKQQDAA